MTGYGVNQAKLLIIRTKNRIGEYSGSDSCMFPSAMSHQPPFDYFVGI